MATDVVLHRSCNVFDHFMIMTALEWPKITSALHKCLEGSNLATECGKTFDNLKNEKKQNEYSA